ncbi:MAG: four-helix bundle copper-binding protein [Pseudobdellovibrio sp.]
MDLQSTLGTAAKQMKNSFKGASDEMQMIMQNYTICHQICEQALSHCLTMGGKHADNMHLETLIDCAEICTVSADFMSRGSKLHSLICFACAEACMACASSCEKFADDEMMKRCAEACRRCEESCRKMVGIKH